MSVQPVVYLESLGILVLQYMLILLIQKQECCEEPGILSQKIAHYIFVFSIVFVCGCNLTLCFRDIIFFCCSTESSSTSTPRQDTVCHCNKAPVVMVCFEVSCVKVIPYVHRRVFSYQSCNRVWVGSCIIKWFMYPLLGLMCLFLAKDHSNILILT